MSDPLVEGLLEKGARAVSPHAWDDDNGWTADTYADVQNNAREIAARVLDAVLPGWREGISREWGWKRPMSPIFVETEAEARRQSAKWLDSSPVSRWVGPWLPVEDGTQ